LKIVSQMYIITLSQSTPNVVVFTADDFQFMNVVLTIEKKR